MEPTANEMLSDVLPSNGMDAQSAIDKVISQRQTQNVGQTETGLDEAQSAINTVIQQRKSPKTQLNSTFASVSGINPDDAAKAQQVGGAIGLGQDLTMRNAAEVKRIADQKRFEMYDLMESDPILGRQMMRREFASVAHDDIPQLTSVGALFKVAYSAATLSPFPKDVASEISQQYEGTQYQTEEALIYHWMNNNNLEEKDLSEETRQRLNFLEQNAPPPINTYLFGGLSYAAGQARSMAPEVAKYAIAGGVTGGALGLAGGPLAPATVAGGVLTGIGLGATAGVGVVTAQIESGMLYKDLLRSGVPKETARTASRIGGTISGLIEMGTLGLAVAPFKMVIKKTVGDVIATRLEKTTVGSAVKTAGKYYAMSEGGEQIEELSQYATAVAVEEFAKSFTDSDYVTIFETPEGRKKFIEQMVDISYQTWKATAIIGSFGPVLNLAVDAKNIRDSAKTKQFLTDLSKNVQATKLKGRSPSALANFVAAQAQGTAAETMYVDAEEMVNVLNQSNLTTQQIDNALPGVREQLAQATSGGDIQIPTAQFAANIVGTKLEAPLMEHARLAPDAISAKQAIAQQETMQQNMKDAQAEMAVQEKVNAQFVREAKEIEKVVNDQLVAAGRPPTEALFAAKLVQARAVTGAAAAGITPAQWVAQHPVPTFQSQQQAAQQAPAKPFVPKKYEETTVTPEQTASLSEPLVAAESELAEAKTANSITERGGKQIGDSLSRLKMALTSGKLGEIGAQTWKLLERLKEIPGMKAASELASKTLAALTKLGVEFYDPTGSVYVEGWVEVEVISWLPYEEGVSKDQPFVEKVISPIVRRNGQIIQRGQVQVREGRIDHEAYLERQAKDAEIEAKMQSELDALQAKLKEEGKTDEVIKQLVAERKAELEAKAREEQYGKEAQQAPAQGSFEQAQIAKIDSDYMAAVEGGDVETQQRMVDEAATKANLTEAFHSTKSKDEISEFRTRTSSINTMGILGETEVTREAAFFTEEENFANAFGKNVKKYFLNTKNIYDAMSYVNDQNIRSSFIEWLGEDVPSSDPESELNLTEKAKYAQNMWQFLDGELGKQFRTFLESKGYSGIKFDEETTSSSGDVVGGTTIAIFNPQDIKSSDLITRDESGNVVPLSRRFNLSSPNTFEQASRADLGLGEQAAFNEASQRPEIVAWAKEKFGDRIAPDGSSVWQNFTEWFGDSKVVDAEGKPMVVYHGTQNEKMNEFSKTRPAYFSADKQLADEFADRSFWGETLNEGEVPTTISAYLSMKNPLVITTEKEYESEMMDKASVGHLLDRGYDGIIYNPDDGGSSYFLTVSPTQIKSAIANVGTFGQQDPNILRQEGYRGEHAAPTNDGYDKPLNNLQGIFPADIYSQDAARLYGTGNEQQDRQAISIIQLAKEKPNTKIKVYRAIPLVLSNAEKIIDIEKQKAEIQRRGYKRWAKKQENPLTYDQLNEELNRLKSLPEEIAVEKPQINDGDWVAINKQYAIDHGESALNGKYRIVTKTVPVKHLFTDGNSIQEWGYDSNAEGTLKQSAVPAAFYSALGVEVGKSTTKSASADSWKQQIKGLIAKGVVKEKEVYWSGLNDWLDLQEGKITKEQVQGFLDAGGVKVEIERSLDEQSAVEQTTRQAIENAKERLKENDLLTSKLVSTFDEYEKLTISSLYLPNEKVGDRKRRLKLEEVIDNALDEIDVTMSWIFEEAEERESGNFANVFEPKYAGYQLPGGTNYREALVTLPEKARDISGYTAELISGPGDMGLAEWQVMNGDRFVGNSISSYTKENAIQTAVSRENREKPTGYMSSHWDQPNVLVHLRLNDRVDADGKKVLFVEEVQSDWGQAGREEGFTTREMTSRRNAFNESRKRLELLQERTPERIKIDKDATKALEKIKNPWFDNWYSAFMDIAEAEDWRTKFDLSSLTKKQIEHLAKRREIQVAELKEQKFQQTEAADNIFEGIPAAPFVETTSGWLELGLKQILLEAVNGGYDRVAFVDGDQSVQRYRQALTGAVDKVEITRNDDGTYTYSAIRGSTSVQGEQSVSANRINEVFGKAGSKQLLEQADAKPNEIHTIASGDIEIGGEGMRKFYDTIVPQALGKMLKKLGGDKIVEVNIGKSTGKKINAKEYADEAVKLIKGDIDVDEFSDNLGIEEGDIPNVWINELMDLPSRTPKAEARKIAIEFAAKVKDRFAGGKSMTQQGFTVTPALAEQVSQGLPLFQAAEGGARGEYDPIKNLIGIGKNADYSTVAHELAHWYVVDLFRTASDAAASEASRSDADILLKWFGIAGDNVDQRLANWNAMTLDEQRRHHEAVAYNWELYLHTGKAPSVELQGVFDRFRRWLTRAYKSIRDDLNEIYRLQFGTDLPFLTDEVRGVFDRMLASEEQISRREAIDNFKGMYQTQEESGMNDATWAAYQAEIAEAHEMAVTDLTKATVKQMEWLSGARKGILKAMQAAHNALRRSVQGEESVKMDNEPVRKAERFFKTGKMVDPSGKEIEVLVGNKIDSVAVGGMYPTSTTGLAPAVDLTKLRGMTMEGGLAPDLAAEMFGFSSGDQLIRALAELKPFKDELKERTDARMLDEHGGMNTEAEKEEAVNKALANEVRARMVAIENRYLTKVKTPVAVIMQGAKELARTILGRMAIKDIKPRNYVAAEARVAKDKHTAVKAMQSSETAGKSAYTRSFNEQIAAGVEESVAASEALAKSVEAIKRAQAKIDAHKKQYGDVDPAIVAAKASHQQVIQGQLAKEGYKILEEVDKALAYVKRIVSDVNRKNMGADHADQIEAILERFGLMGRYVAPTTRTPLATWAQVQQDIGFDIEIPDIVQESVRKNFLELTPEEFQDVIDTVKQIAHTGKSQQLVLTMDRKITFEKAKTEIVDSINANAGGRKAKTRTATTNIGRSIETLTGFFAAHLKAAIVAQIMDGGKDGGPLWNYLIRSANTAGNKETTMRAAATKRISEILDPVFKGGKMGGAGVYFPSVDRSFNRESVLTIALNMGNESNMQRLLDGEGWTLEQVMPIIQSLTAAELNAVQEVWDYSETFKAEIIEKSRRTVGREPNWIEPKPFQVMSADGQMVSLKGGYYPVKYDPRASARSQSLSAAEQALRDLKDAYIASTTRRSYTKSRVKEVYDRPLLLNLSGLYSGIGEVIHDLSWHEWLIDSNRLMRSSAFDKAVREQYGIEFKDQITSWIKDVAAGDKGANNAGEMALNYLRQGVSAAGLGFNLMSAVGQITGFAQSVVKVGAKWIGRGIAVSASNPSAAIERVYALSPFMANRGSTQFRELNEIKNMVRGENVAMKRVKTGTYFLMMQMQRMVDVPTWIGAYEKQLSINSDEKLAIAIADQAVIDSQGGGMLKDLSAIERGGPIQKLFTVFYSFMNTNLNLAVLKGMTEKNAGKWVAQQTMLWVVPVVTMYMLKKLLTPQAGDDDDKFDLKEMAKELAAEELSFLMGSFMVVREFADAAKIVTGAKTYGTDYRGPAGLRMIGDTYKFATQAAQLEFDTAFRKAAINIIGSSSGLPAAQINRTIDGIEALLEGETENITAPLFGVKKR